MKNRKLLFIIIQIAVFNLNLFAQDITCIPGQITDSIKVKNTVDQSYQLYVPSYYSEDKNWPVVFIFEPAARGNVGIKPFIKSSEFYGYILICSNNSRNNPFSINYRIADSLFSDVLNRLPVDTSRLYLAGFSGGSRLSSSIASKKRNIKGVIACGAGLPPTDYFNYNSGLNFLYAGIVGDRDMNYIEMLNNKHVFKKMGLSNTLFIYEGNHEWPPDSIILRAFDWLEMKYLKNNTMYKAELITQLYLKDYSIAINNEKSDKLIDAHYELNKLRENYSQYFQIDSINYKISLLEKNRKFKQSLKNKQKFESYEQELTQSYFEIIAISLFSKSDTIYDYWKFEAKKLQTQLKSKNLEKSKMAARIQAKILVWCYESGLDFTKNNEMEFFLFANRLWILIKPNDVYPNFQLAKYSSSLGDQKKTFFYLEKCVENGFKNKSLLIETNDFKSIKNSKEFQSLISLMESAK